MRFLAIVVRYLIWHYGRAILEFSHIYKNLIAFVFNFFSISILLKSYLAPWRRLGESYPKDPTDLAGWASTLVVNLIMRAVGIVMRTIIIVIGLVLTIVVTITYPIWLILWLVLPLIVIILILLGFGLLFK